MLDFLEAAHTNRLIGGLRRYQQHRRVVPIGSLHRGHKTRNAGAVLGNRHRDFAGGAGIAVTDQAAIRFLRHIPKRDACFGKKV